MQKRGGRSFAPQPVLPSRLDLGRTAREWPARSVLLPPAALPSQSAALSCRAALFGAVTVAGCSATAVVPAAVQAAVSSSNDRRLDVMAHTLDTLQVRANRHAAGAGSDPADPYTQAVAEMDLVAAGVAMLRADTMAGVQVKLRAVAVPIMQDDDEAHGLALAVCRDLRRLQTAGALS